MRLDSVAVAIRSKNAGPTLLTLDVIFPTVDLYLKAVGAIPRLKAHVAKSYGKKLSDVHIFPYPPSRALKITIPRSQMSGVLGDTDVYGAQQHSPLLAFEI